MTWIHHKFWNTLYELLAKARSARLQDIQIFLSKHEGTKWLVSDKNTFITQNEHPSKMFKYPDS